MKFPVRWIIPGAAAATLLASGTAMAMAGETESQRSPDPAVTVSQAPGLLRILDLTWAPEDLVAGGRVTFTAQVGDAEGAIWEWSISGPGGTAVASGTSAGQWTYELPADAPSDLLLQLTVRKDGRAVTRNERIPVGKPAVTVSLTCKPTTKTAKEFVSCSPAATNVPDRAELNWKLTAPNGKVHIGPWYEGSGPLGFSDIDEVGKWTLLVHTTGKEPQVTSETVTITVTETVSTVSGK